MDPAREAPAAAAEDGDVIHQSFSVTYDYQVRFTQGVFAPDNPVLVDCLTAREPARRHRLMVLVDDGLAAATPGLVDRIGAYAAAHGNRLALAAPPLLVQGGEACKNDPAHLNRALDAIQAAGLDRQSFVVAVGGGAVLDMAGYAAAVAHRGIRHVRLPTTVLSQNDSGVGVKNGVNAYGAKNYLGTFAPPFAVINDRDFLATLEDRDKRAGLAEAVKVALIRDLAFFQRLEAEAPALAAFDPEAMTRAIRDCARLHMAHIAQGGDPFEVGSARPLDYGHWAAHKLEGLTHHEIRHGEAVAIGLALDTRYAVEIGILAADRQARIQTLLEALGFTLWSDALEAPGADGRPAVLKGIDEFREHLGGDLSVTMLTDLGQAIEVHDLDEPAIGRALAWLKARHANR
ncbi:MAG: 3-dehydroquinate synthase [Rhodobacterales bacterium]|nr:3-dehydroquinate synthase [Rhodobacterales bacterium]